jgi:hypothetical protein
MEGEEAGDAEAVEDLALEDHAEAVVEGDPGEVDDFAGVGVEGGDALVLVGGEEVAWVMEGVEAWVEEEEGLGVEAADAGFLEQFAGDGLGWGFAVVDSAAGDFPGEGVEEEAVLADEEDAVLIGEDEACAGADLGDEVLFGEGAEVGVDAEHLLVGVLVDELARPDARGGHAGDGVTLGVWGLRKKAGSPGEGGWG